MSSKRQRASTSHSSSRFDLHRFVTEDASDRYHNVLLNKSFVLERGLIPDLEQDRVMCSMIAQRNWEKLTEQPTPAVVSIVKEFYANAINRINFVVQVRGKSVAFDESAINSYFNIDTTEIDDEYDESYDLDEVIRKLCKPGTEWTLRQGTTEKVSFIHTALSRYGKAWYSFICANLMPTRHQNAVTTDRAILLFNIVSTSDINIGSIIQQSILKCLRGKTSGGLPHASLITGLCKRSGVQWDADEILLLPMTPIDHATIVRYKVWEGGVSHPRGRGFIIPQLQDAQAEAEPEPVQVEQQMDQNNYTDILTAVQSLQRQVHRQDRRIRKQGQKIDAIAQRMDAMMQFNIDFNNSLAQIFSGASSSFASSAVQFPTPPIVHDYPQDSTDEEFDNDA